MPPPPSKRSKKDWPSDLKEADHTLNNITQDFLDCPGPSGSTARLISSTPAANNAQQEKQVYSSSKTTLTNTESHKSTSCTTRESFSKALFNKTVSSRKRPVDEILNTSAHLQGHRSLFADNSDKASTSRHGVEFDISALKNYSSTNKFKPESNDRTLRSPFYPGRTMYGGASAYSRIPERLTSFAEIKKPIRSSIQIQPVNKSSANQSNTMSQTARRIMEALDQYTPKLPIVEHSPPNKPALVQTRKRFGTEERILNQTLGFSQRATRNKPYSRTPGHKFNRSFNCELQVATVPDLLKMRKRERLQESTKAVRELAKNSNSNLNKPVSEYTLRTEVRNIENQDKQKINSRNKNIKTISGEDPALEEKSAPAPNLGSIQLSITSLPKFDMIPPPPPVVSSIKSTVINQKTTVISSTAAVCNTVISKPITVTSNLITPKTDTKIANNNIAPTEVATFEFAPPIKVCEGNNIAAAVNNFKFSVPLRITMEKKLEMKFDPTNVKLKRKPVLDNVIPKSVGIPIAEELKSGSVMDILKSQGSKTVNNNLDAFKPSKSATWECQSCLVRNKIEVEKCVACETKKVNKSVTMSESHVNQHSFGDKFKLPVDKWECQTCMIHNEAKAVNCIACTTPKTGVVTSSEAPKQQNNIAVSGFSGFGDKFKPSSDLWSCDVCMIKNKSIDSKCIACESPKPGVKPASTTNVSSFSLKPPIASTDSGFMDLIKKQNSKWECSGCMTRNDANRAKCACCEAPKPGVIPETAQFSFGALPPTEFKFGIDKTDSSQTNLKVSGFSKADSKTNTSSNSFSFGIPSDKREPEKKEGLAALTKPQVATGFTFGIPQTTEVTKTVLPKKVVDLNSSKLDDEKIDKKNSVTSTTEFSLPTKPVVPLFGTTFSGKTTATEGIATTSIKTKLATSESITSKPVVSPSDSSSSKTTKSADFGNSKLSTPTTSAGALFTFGSSNSTAPIATVVSSNLVTSSTLSLPSYQPTKPTTTSMFTFTSVNNTDNKLKLDNSKLENNNTTLNKINYDGFGSLVSTAEPPKPALPGFGSSGGFGGLKQTEQKNAGFQFGASENKSFSFNSNKESSSSTTAKSDLFSFGAKSEEKRGSPLPFTFTATAPRATTPGFGFGSLNKSTTLNTQSNLFGTQNTNPAVMSFNSQPTPSPATNSTQNQTFGTPATSVFGAPANSGFGNPTTGTFGANINSTPAFQFGATSVNQNPAVFAFGTNRQQSSDPQPVASGAFTFGSSTPNMPQPTAAIQPAPNAFNPDVAPAFNFNMGSNPTSFTAAPATSGAAAGRKIKRAVRRAPPR